MSRESNELWTDTLRRLQPGRSVTVTRDYTGTMSASRLTRMIAAYVVRLCPGDARYTYETFNAITSRGRAITGAIVTRSG